MEEVSLLSPVRRQPWRTDGEQTPASETVASPAPAPPAMAYAGDPAAAEPHWGSRRREDVPLLGTENHATAGLQATSSAAIVKREGGPQSPAGRPTNEQQQQQSPADEMTTELMSDAEASVMHEGRVLSTDALSIHEKRARMHWEADQAKLVRQVPPEMAAAAAGVADVPLPRDIAAIDEFGRPKDEVPSDVLQPVMSSRAHRGAVGRSILVEVLLGSDETGPDDTSTFKYPVRANMSTPLVPNSAVMVVNASSKRQLVEAIENRLAAKFDVFADVVSFQFTPGLRHPPQQFGPTGELLQTQSTPYSNLDSMEAEWARRFQQFKVGPGEWRAVNVIDDDEELLQQLATPHVPQNTAERLAHGHTAQGAALGIPTEHAPVPKMGPGQVPFAALPTEVTMKLHLRVRRLTFVVTCLMSGRHLRSLVSLGGPDPDAERGISGSQLFQRRASAYVESIQSLCNALAPLVNHGVRPRHLLFCNPPRQDTENSGYAAPRRGPPTFTPLRHIGQLEDFSYLLCNFVEIDKKKNNIGAALARLHRGSTSTTGLSPLPPALSLQHSTDGASDVVVSPPDDSDHDGWAAEDEENLETRQREEEIVFKYGGVLKLDRAHLAFSEAEVTKENAPHMLPGESASAELTNDAQPGADQRIRFSIPRCVRTPFAPESLEGSPVPKANATTSMSAPPPLPTGQELIRQEAESLQRHAAMPQNIESAAALDPNQHEGRPMPDPPAIIPSVLPLPDENSPPRAPIDLYRMVFQESLMRFPQTTGGPAGRKLKTPATEGASGLQRHPGTLGATAVGTYPPREERRVLIQIALHTCMQHPQKDYFKASQLVSLTSDIVELFRAQYPEGVAVRFPLSRTDKDALEAIVNRRIMSELSAGLNPAFRKILADQGSAVAAAATKLRSGLPSFQEMDASEVGAPRGHQLSRGGATGAGYGRPGMDPGIFGSFAASAANVAAGALSPPRFSEHSPGGHSVGPMSPGSPGRGLAVPTSLSPDAAVVLTRPTWDGVKKRLTVVATVGFDMLEGTSAALALQDNTSLQAAIGLPKADGHAGKPFSWCLLRGMKHSSTEVPLEPLFALGVARIHVLSHVVPITVSLEIDLSVSPTMAKAIRGNQLRGGLSEMPFVSPLQEGIAYTVGFAAVRRDASFNDTPEGRRRQGTGLPAPVGEGLTVHATQTFVIPAGSGVGDRPEPKEEPLARAIPIPE